MPRLLRAIGTLALAPPAILLSGCAGTGCEEWGTRMEAVTACGPKGTNCTVRDQPVQYCVRRTGEPAAPALASGGKGPVAAAPRPKEGAEARASGKTGKADTLPSRPESGQKARTKTGAPDLTAFWRALFSASRYPGLRYDKVKRVTTGPKTTPASSAQVEAAIKTHVRAVVSMHVASDSKSTPMEHQLGAVVYRAHNRDAAAALYSAILRDEWREKKAQSKPGVSLVVVNTGDRKKPEASGQRTYLQRGSYVVEVNEWKSIYTDAAGKPVPGKRFPHSGPMSPDVVAKAVVGTFPAE